MYQKDMENELKNEPKPPMPGEKLNKPGIEAEMTLKPQYEAPHYKAAGKLQGKCALITGGDSGIGRAVAYLYAREGAIVTISCLPTEMRDAHETQKSIEAAGGKCFIVPGDLTDKTFCEELIDHSVAEMGSLDILVSNAAYQSARESLEEISIEEWEKTFKTNITAYYLLVKAAVPYLKPGSAIIATSSVTALRGHSKLLDYSATKGAINSFTKSLSQALIKKGIRVNAVAPGPVWTPLNPADPGRSSEEIKHFGEDTPYGRPAQPEEIAPAYVFLASDADSSYVSGMILTQTGGET